MKQWPTRYRIQAQFTQFPLHLIDKLFLLNFFLSFFKNGIAGDSIGRLQYVLPILYISPDFIHENWIGYFTFHSHTRNRMQSRIQALNNAIIELSDTFPIDLDGLSIYLYGETISIRSLF